MFNGPSPLRSALDHVFKVSGDVNRYETEDDDNFTQPGAFWRKVKIYSQSYTTMKFLLQRQNLFLYAFAILFFAQVLKPDERQRLVENISGHLRNANETIRQRAVKIFSQVDPEFGRGVDKALSH